MTSHVLVIRLFCALVLLTQVTSHGAEGSGVAPPPGVKALTAPGIHNLFALGTNVLSGSVPEGEEAFAALARLGVKTIITVDGGKPDLEAAHRHGIRYVHLPHGYNGINTNLQLQLVKAAQELPGPIFVHCHHGKHRGPTAAAVICMGKEGWSQDQANAWLKTAGTATNYGGLYGVIANYRKPAAAELKRLSSEFPEVAKVSGLVDAMVEIDEHWEHLKAVRGAGYRVPPNSPDIVPPNEAVVLWENFREAQRLPESAKLGDDFIKRLKSSEDHVKEAEQLLRDYLRLPSAEIKAKLDQRFDAVAQDCTACHKVFRDKAAVKAVK